VSAVAISGAGGFIGRRLTRRLRAAGHRVIGIARRAVDPAEVDVAIEGVLGESLAPALARYRPEVVVHAAHASGPDAYQRNVEGTWRWFGEAREAGARLQILLGSLSADAAAASDYGRAKAELERRFLSGGGGVLRLGLVVGNGGMFARMERSLRRWLVPLPDGGRTPVELIGVDAVCEVLMHAVEATGPPLAGRALAPNQPDPPTLRALLLAIRRHYRHRALLVPVPSRALLAAVVALERIGLRLPVDSANLRGLRRADGRGQHSDHAEFGLPVESLDELVARAAAEAGVSPR